MSGETFEDLPSVQGDCLDREEQVDVTVEGLDKSGDQVRDSGGADNTSKESADATNTGAESTPPHADNSVVSSTAIPSYLQDLFAGMVASMRAGNLELVNELKESNQQLQRGVEQKINDSNQQLQSRVEQKINDSNQQLQSKVEQKINESNQQLQSRVEQKINESNQQMREDIRKENESLINQFSLDTEKLRQDFSERLESETTRLAQQIRLVQGDTERELVGVQKKFQGMTSEFDARLEQQSRSNSEVADELTSKIIEVRSEIGEVRGKVNDLIKDVEIVKSGIVVRTQDLEKRQGERIAQLNKEVESEKAGNERRFELLSSAINTLKDKLADGTPATYSAEVTGAVPVSPPPLNAVNVNNVNGTGSASCSCNLNSCTLCMNGCVNGEDATVPVHHHSANSYLSYNDFPLPLFGDNSEINPIFHLNQLDEFIRLRSVPKQFQLAIAFKSIVGVVGKQWVATVARNLVDYEQFKIAFANTYWSRSKQSLVRCSLYQDKFDPRSGISLSSHFLRYATMATYLEPRPTDVDVIEAVRHHFPVMVQRAMIGTQLRTVEQALDLLRRVELMGEDGSYQRSNPVPPHPNPTLNQDQNRRWGNDRGQPNQHYSRRVQYDRRNNYGRNNNWRGPQTHGGFDSFARGNEQANDRPAAVQSLNPHAQTFACTDEQRRAGSTNRTSQNGGN
jgi:hypothetical protein